MLLIAPLLIALFAPIGPVYAQGPTLSVRPPVTQTTPLSFFDIFVDIADVTDLVGYDVTVSYDEAQLDLLTSHVSGALLDPDNGDTLLLANTRLPGSVRVAATLLGLSIDVGSSGGLLIVMRFRAILLGESAIALGPTTVVVAAMGGGVMSIPHSTQSGIVRVGTSGTGVFFKSWGVKSSDQVLRLSIFERTTELQARLKNNGTADMYAVVVFTAVNSGGLRIGLPTLCTLVPHQNGANNIAAEVSAVLRVDPVPTTWVATAVLRVGSMADCSDTRPVEVKTIVTPFVVVP